MAFLDFFRRLAAGSGAGDEAYNNLYGGTDAYRPNMPQGRGVGMQMGMNLPGGLNAPLQSSDPAPDPGLDQAVASVGDSVRNGLLQRSIKSLDTHRDVKDVPNPSQIAKDKLGIDTGAVTPPPLLDDKQLQDAFRILFRRRF